MVVMNVSTNGTSLFYHGEHHIREVKVLTNANCRNYDLRFAVWMPGALNLWMKLFYDQFLQVGCLTSAMIEPFPGDVDGAAGTAVVARNPDLQDSLNMLLTWKQDESILFARVMRSFENPGGVVLWHSPRNHWPVEKMEKYIEDQKQVRDELLSFGVLLKTKWDWNQHKDLL